MESRPEAQGDSKDNFLPCFSRNGGRGKLLGCCCCCWGTPAFLNKVSHYPLSLVLHLGPREVRSKKGRGRGGLWGRVNQTQIPLCGLILLIRLINSFTISLCLCFFPCKVRIMIPSSKGFCEVQQSLQVHGEQPVEDLSHRCPGQVLVHFPFPLSKGPGGTWGLQPPSICCLL